MSKGEDKIERILREACIPFEREKVFPTLRNGKLRFDFYLPQSGVLIELDGRQHFVQVKKFQPTISDFNHAKQNDYFKNSYALSHNLSLFRIPFWEIDNIKTATDLFSAKYRVLTKWHNDIVYREYLKSQSR